MSRRWPVRPRCRGGLPRPGLRRPRRAALGPPRARRPRGDHAGTTAAHLARAALEGIAYQVADMLEAMSEDAGFPLDELRVDGGQRRTTS
jgi:sugar (pentulose or hexulose) kinase